MWPPPCPPWPAPSWPPCLCFSLTNRRTKRPSPRPAHRADRRWHNFRACAGFLRRYPRSGPRHRPAGSAPKVFHQTLVERMPRCPSHSGSELHRVPDNRFFVTATERLQGAAPFGLRPILHWLGTPFSHCENSRLQSKHGSGERGMRRRRAYAAGAVRRRRAARAMSAK